MGVRPVSDGVRQFAVSAPLAPYGLWCGDYKAENAQITAAGSLQTMYAHTLAGNLPEYIKSVFTYYESVLDDLAQEQLPSLRLPRHFGAGGHGARDGRIRQRGQPGAALYGGRRLALPALLRLLPRHRGHQVSQRSRPAVHAGSGDVL